MERSKSALSQGRLKISKNQPYQSGWFFCVYAGLVERLAGETAQAKHSCMLCSEFVTIQRSILNKQCVDFVGWISNAHPPYCRMHYRLSGLRTTHGLCKQGPESLPELNQNGSLINLATNTFTKTHAVKL
jgi:hypothetical protein